MNNDFFDEPGSGFSYADEYNEDINQSEDLSVYEDDSLTDFEDDDMYDEVFTEEVETDETEYDLDDDPEGFNDEFEDLSTQDLE